jgi:hypothetical protein
MPNFADARIPVIVAAAASAGPGDALLIEGPAPAPAGVPVARFVVSGHLAGCACCAPRGAVAEALHRLFLARARDAGAFFTRVIVVAGAAGEAAVRQALAEDAFLAGRYRGVAPNPSRGFAPAPHQGHSPWNPFV